MTLVQTTNGLEAPVYIYIPNSTSEYSSMVRVDNAQRYVLLADHLEMLKRREDLTKNVSELSAENYKLQQLVNAIRTTVHLKGCRCVGLNECVACMVNDLLKRESATPDR